VVQTLPGNKSDVAVLKVSGPLSIHNFFEFQELSREQSSGILIVDLSDVPYIDSAALGCLVGIHVSREKNGRKYAIVGANDRLHKVFAMTGISQFLVNYPTMREAEAALG